MKLNDDQVMRQIVLAFNGLGDCSPSETAQLGQAHKDYLYSKGLATYDQMDRCAKQLVVYYMEHGCVPPYKREM
jgi:hypothetical protein|tara:strand:- start:1420 stop:1641 length:222 start_codon:yes stop_codon:yes gene_type:complete